MNKIEIGKIIQTRRERLKIKQEDLGEMAGTSAKTIYLIETGKGNPSLETLSKIMEIVGLELFVDIKKIPE